MKSLGNKPDPETAEGYFVMSCFEPVLGELVIESYQGDLVNGLYHGFGELKLKNGHYYKVKPAIVRLSLKFISSLAFRGHSIMECYMEKDYLNGLQA